MDYDRETSRLLTGIPKWYYIPRRYVMVILGFLSTFVCYLLRTNISVAVIPICHEFGWTYARKGTILSSFFWGYIIPQMPTSWLATRFGCKVVLGWGLFFASIFTIMTPFVAHRFELLLLSRVLTGFSEAVTYPTLTVMIANWIPPPERTRFISIIWGGSYIGTVAAMVSGPPLIVQFGWKGLFLINGAIGIFWAFLWLLFAASYPNDMKGIHPAEIEHICHKYSTGVMKESGNSVSIDIFGKLCSSIHVWAIIVANFCNNWGFYILLTWLPTYLSEQLHFTLSKTGFLAVLPYIGLFSVCVIAGRMADILITFKINITFLRKLFGVIATVMPAACLMIVSMTHVPLIAIAGMICSISFTGFSVSSYNVNSLDIAPKYAGIVTGMANTAGTIPGIVGVLLTGFMLEEWHSWPMVFTIAAGVYCFSAFFWVLFSTAKKVF